MEATDYCFSFFRKPIQNIEPLRAIGIVDVYRYVVGHYAQPQTEALRSITSPADVKKYKASHFVAKGRYVGERCGARLFPALRPTSIYKP